MRDTIADINVSGDLTGVLVYANDATGGLLSPLIVFAFFTVILFGGFFISKRLGGRGDLAVSFASASFASFGLSILFFLRAGLINPLVPVVCLGLSILAAIMLYFSGRE